MIVEIKSKGHQSNSGWHRTGCQHWWIQFEEGGYRKFVEIPRTRGDQTLEIKIEVPDSCTTLWIGAGKANVGKRYDAYRETIEIKTEEEA